MPALATLQGRKGWRCIKASLQTKQAGSTHWSTRSLALDQGVSENTIQWAVVGPRAETAPDQDLQALPRFAYSVKIHGRGRRLSDATPERRGTVRR